MSIILITILDFSVDFLMQKKAVWGKLIDKIVKKVKKDIHWNKIIIHRISIQLFSINEGLKMLKNEIKIFNPQLKLIKKPAWLYSKENR